MNYLKVNLLLTALFLGGWNLSAQDFHLVFLNQRADKPELPESEVKKLMEGHMANINRLASEGKLWAAGPFDGGGGIFIFKTSSLQDVKDWVLTDPAVQAGRWNVEMFPYFPRTGSVCRVGETYEMTHYFFVRFTGPSNRTEEHRNYIASSSMKESVITEAGLGDGNGSILILKEEPSSTWLNDNPAVKDGKWSPVLKKLYIARGSFCEPK